MTEPKHSPLKISRLSDDVRTLISNKDSHLVLQTIGDKYYELAKLVVRAVNSHDKLVEACRAWIDYMDSDLSQGEKILVEHTRQALADTEGQ